MRSAVEAQSIRTIIIAVMTMITMQLGEQRWNDSEGPTGLTFYASG